MAIFISKEENGLHKIFYEQQEFGKVKTYWNDFHNTNCYVQLELIEYKDEIAEELFEKLQKIVNCPLQVMVSSDDKKQITFLEKGGFICKRKCYEMEVTAADYIGKTDKSETFFHCEKGSFAYDKCVKLLFDYYAETHEKISPLTATYEEFCATLPQQAVCQAMENQIVNVAFVEENEIAYVASASHDSFTNFISSVVMDMFEKFEDIFFECDDCDWAAIELRALFIVCPEESYNTYIRG